MAIRGSVLENLTGAIVEACRSGLTPDALREGVLRRLRRAVPFDAAFWSIVDPVTLLFTQPHQEEIPADTVPYFIQNEFLDDDVNKWTALAREPGGVRTLIEATAGDMDASARHRDVFRPLGLGDELRAVLRTRGTCWGVLCLHRETGAAFSHDEVLYVRRLAPHIAEGIRATLLLASAETAGGGDAPGLVVMGPDGSLASITEAGERWLEELGHPDPRGNGLPIELQALAAAGPRSTTLRTRAGRWAVLHASRLSLAEGPAVAVIIQEPAPAEIAPILMLAYGLTPREQVVTALVCRGLSTRELADGLHITPHTLQDHLKSIFEKTGVSSRRELAAVILREQYLPRAMAGQPVGEPSRDHHMVVE
jgi:DNA-binding CsgD family transcriptional regulator